MSIHKVSGGGKTQGIFMPTKDQLVQTYRSIAEGALKDGKAHQLKHAPANAEKYPHYNITEKGLMGVGKEVYVIKGQLYLKTQVVAPNAQPSWYKIGPAPMF